MLDTEIKTIRVSARQINAAANQIQGCYSALYRHYRELAVTAAEGNGFADIEADGALAGVIKSL